MSTPKAAPRPTVRARVPVPMASALEAAAERTGQSPSEILRDALAEKLSRLGVWPPAKRARPAAEAV